MSSWMMDALAMSDGTVAGLAKVLAEQIPNLPPEAVPEKFRKLSKREILEEMTEAVEDAYICSNVIKEHLDAEVAKGRDIQDVYEEVKPYIDHRRRKFAVDEEDEDLFDLPGQKKTRDADPSYTAALMQARRSCAPHRRLRELPTDPRQTRGDHFYRASDPISTVSLLSSNTRLYPRPREIREPLMLVGSINNYSLTEAAKWYSFNFVGRRDASQQESKVRVEVPADGMYFQIVSVTQGLKWRLMPATPQRELEDGDRQRVQVNVVHDKNATDSPDVFRNCFEIKGTGNEGTADVWVSLSITKGVEVWFMDLA